MTTENNNNLNSAESVFVKTIEGNGHIIPYLDNMTGKQVKNRIKAITGYSVELQSIVFQGRELENNVKLSDLGINKGATV
jgi:hypothetical protein